MWDTVRDIRRGDGRGPQNEREGRNGSNAATSRTFFIWSNNSVLDCLTEANINQDLLEGKVNVNVVGRVRNTRAPSSPLLPVYEAIVNSIHAIDDVKTHDSLITIQIVRGQDAQKSLDDEDPARPGPVQGFIIRDNGVGFVDENYRSFVESDSQRKALLGGKGVGRFVWLKVFDRAEIESVFRDGSEFRRRYFRFELTPEGITNHRVEATDRGSRQLLGRKLWSTVSSIGGGVRVTHVQLLISLTTASNTLPLAYVRPSASKIPMVMARSVSMTSIPTNSRLPQLWTSSPLRGVP